MSVPLHEAHIIVVEDNPNNRLVILKLLKLIGVTHCNWQASGRQAVEFVRCMSQASGQRRPDLILLDIGLPYEDGYAVLSELRLDPTLKDTRVVVVTAHSSPEEMQYARQAGFNGFISKPIDPLRFPDQIRRILAGENVWEL